MPGWKKNIPACLQPDQEGGKTRPSRTGPSCSGSDRPGTSAFVCYYTCVCAHVYTLCVCACVRASPRTNYRRCDLVQRGLAPPAELVQTATVEIIESW